MIAVSNYTFDEKGWIIRRLGDWETRRTGDMEKKSQIKTHEDLMVYQLAFSSAMKIFKLSQKFPVEERYSLTDQMRRSSRSVCANLAEEARKRRYRAAFIAKLSDCEAVLKDTASHKAAETQVWLKFAERV